MDLQPVVQPRGRFCGRRRRHSPFVATPVTADTEVLVDRVRGIALVAAALSCGREQAKVCLFTHSSRTRPPPPLVPASSQLHP